MIFDNKCQIRLKMLLNLSFEQFLTYTFTVMAALIFHLS